MATKPVKGATTPTANHKVYVGKTGLSTEEARKQQAIRLCKCWGDYNAAERIPNPHNDEIFEFERAHGGDFWECLKKEE